MSNSTTIEARIVPTPESSTIGDITVSHDELNAVITFQINSVGENSADDGERIALMNVYLDDPSLFAEDLAVYRASLPPTPSEPTPAEPTPPVNPTETANTHEAAVADIVGMIRAKYKDEGERNFAIGARVETHALWQAANFTGYESQDLDNLMNRIRDDVRIHVAISPKAIKVGEWLRCHFLRKYAIAAIGSDLANKLTFFEYRSIYGEALSFSKSEVSGSIKPGWIEFIKDIATTRYSGGAISSEKFFKRFEACKARIAASKAEADPVAAAYKAAKDKLKWDSKAKVKANDAVVDSITNGIKAGHIDMEDVFKLVSSAASLLEIPLPAFGFDASTATTESCDQLVAAMFAAKKFKEMVHLRNKLNKVLAPAEQARANTHGLPSPKLAVAS